jgi:hypothetical protein
MNILPKSVRFLPVILFSLFINISAQDSTITGLTYIELKDGSTFSGYVIEENEETLKIRTLSDIEIEIPKVQVIKRSIISGEIMEGELWYEDPNTTRMFFAPTGRGLKAGQGYFSVYEIFFPFIAVGITDWLAISGGMSLVPGAEDQILYIAPKITPVSTGSFDLSAGVLFVKPPNADEGGGIAYGVGTFGSSKTSLTFGVGFGFSGGDFADKPILVVGADVRVSRSVKFVTENWIMIDEGSLISFGLRFFGTSIAGDFGLVYSTENGGDGFPFLPWLGFAYNFGE